MTPEEKQVIEELIRAVEVLREEASAAGLVYTASGIREAVEQVNVVISNS